MTSGLALFRAVPDGDGDRGGVSGRLLNALRLSVVERSFVDFLLLGGGFSGVCGVSMTGAGTGR